MNELLITLLPIYKYSMAYGNMTLTAMTMFPTDMVIEGEEHRTETMFLWVVFVN